MRLIYEKNCPEDTSTSIRLIFPRLEPLHFDLAFHQEADQNLTINCKINLLQRNCYQFNGLFGQQHRRARTSETEERK